MTTPISTEAALGRIRDSEITLQEAFDMSDRQLLALPRIGRRTLRFIRDRDWVWSCS